MPQLYSIESYAIYFWVNEGMPTEPVHVHILQKRPSPDGTKVWGGTLVCHNRSKIPERALRQLCRFIAANTLTS